jgi:ketosteroid isomerase-like protein
MSGSYQELGAVEAELEQLRGEVDRMKAELNRLSDRQAIVDCLTRYTRGLDRHDANILTSAYHADAIDHHDPFVGSPAEFVPWANQFHEADYVAHTHAITNNSVEIDGDVAHSETYVQATMRRKDGLLDIRGARYIDRLERRDGVWRIAAREVLVDWASTTSGGVVQGHPTGTWDRSDVSYQRPLRVPARDAPVMASLGSAANCDGGKA